MFLHNSFYIRNIKNLAKKYVTKADFEILDLFIMIQILVIKFIGFHYEGGGTTINIFFFLVEQF